MRCPCRRSIRLNNFYASDNEHLSPTVVTTTLGPTDEPGSPKQTVPKTNINPKVPFHRFESHNLVHSIVVTIIVVLKLNYSDINDKYFTVNISLTIILHHKHK